LSSCEVEKKRKQDGEEQKSICRQYQWHFHVLSLGEIPVKSIDDGRFRNPRRGFRLGRRRLEMPDDLTDENRFFL
jgi:hypothetical protein